MISQESFEAVQSHDPKNMRWDIRVQVLTTPLFVKCDLADGKFDSKKCGEAVAHVALGLEMDAEKGALDWPNLFLIETSQNGVEIPAGGYLRISSDGAKVKDWKPLFDKLLFCTETTELGTALLRGSGYCSVRYTRVNSVSLYVEASFRLYQQ